MKKIMVMFMMMVLATFASPLFAISESPPNFENTLKANAGLKNVSTNVESVVVAAHVDEKVIISYKDTLMQPGISGGNKIENKLTSNVTAGFKEAGQASALTIATKAVVCLGADS